MKKIIISVAFLLAMICVLTSCFDRRIATATAYKDENYELALLANNKGHNGLCDEIETALKINNMSGFALKNETHIENNHRGEEMEIEWLGQSYSCEYAKTYDTYYYDGLADEYVANSPDYNSKTVFIVDRQTKALLSANSTYKQYDDRYSELQQVDASVCQTKANEMFKSLATNGMKYTLHDIQKTETEYGYVQTYNYYKTVGGYYTIDRISIRINNFGVCEGYSTCYNKQNENIVLPDTYSDDKFNSSVQRRLNQMYKEIAKNHVLKSNIISKLLMKDENGKIGFICEIELSVHNIEMQEFDSNGGVYADYNNLIDVFVIIE